MAGKWAKDSCPFCKDQGFYSVIGDVKPGEIIFGFPYVMGRSPDTLDFETETGGKVREMADINYRVFAVRVDLGSVSEATIYSVSNKTKLSFDLAGDDGGSYDVVVVGRVLNY